MTKRSKRREFGSIRLLDSSGRWQASYLNPRDKEHRINGPTTYAEQRHAEAWLNDERRKIELGTWTRPHERGAAAVTLEDFGHDWLKNHGIQNSTRNLYPDRLEDHVFPYLCDRRLSSLTTADIRKWRRDRKGAASESFIGNAYTALSSMLSSAVEDEVIDRNPCTLNRLRFLAAPMCVALTPVGGHGVMRLLEMPRSGRIVAFRT